MKLVFTKSNLNKAVGIVMKAVPTRTTMNILECILIDATTMKSSSQVTIWNLALKL
jgi:DNA polymerase-3 subunit beta